MDETALLLALIAIPTGLFISAYLCAKISRWSRIVEARSKLIGANKEISQ